MAKFIEIIIDGKRKAVPLSETNGEVLTIDTSKDSDLTWGEGGTASDDTYFINTVLGENILIP